MNREELVFSAISFEPSKLCLVYNEGRAPLTTVLNCRSKEQISVAVDSKTHENVLPYCFYLFIVVVADKFPKGT